MTTGLDHIHQMFAASQKRAVFMPYFPVGFPDLATSLDILEGLAKNGADALEIGVPFSDPLADGVVIQHATQIALKNGISLTDCILAVKELRQRGVTIPLLLMSYVNPLLSYGNSELDILFDHANAAGVSGFIVPDLPPDEAEDFQAMAQKYQLAYPHFLAPTSDEKRIQLVAQNASGFIYLVSVTGVTGARQDEGVSDELRAFIGRVRQIAKQPLVVGFGISSPAKAKAVGELAEGLIIGSKLISLAQESPQSVFDFSALVVQALKD